MLIRFGYVAMSMFVQNASPSKTMTATQFEKLPDREAAIRKLERITSENLANTLRILSHNRAHDIEVYRFSSKLIPLIGHSLLQGWNPLEHETIQEGFARIGDYVNKYQMRTSFHPDHFTVFSTPRNEVLESSIAILNRHVTMFELMGLDTDAKCNIHIGGTYGDKQSAYDRFIRQLGGLERRILDRMTLENDDKTFTALETLTACEHLQVPMVLDLHHHQVNNKGEVIDQLWPRIVATWPHPDRLPPKIHVSSPRNDLDQRAHADFVEPHHLLNFLRTIAQETPKLDIMIEAKKKDEALFRLVEQLSQQPHVERVNQASIVL